MSCGRNIKLLPQDVITKLRSCVAISSVSQCVEELVLNAVDSCAKNVAVRLDLTFFKIQVVDNGFGIPRDQLDLIGERYHTSKCHDLEDLKNLRYNGFRGEALASLRDICAVLEITSRTQDNRTYFKAFHYGKKTEVRLSVDERPSVGTTVTILDFMYNLPVRRKSICTFRDFESTRHALECIALVNPNVSFTLRNNQTGETCLNTRRTNSMTSSFRMLFECDKYLKEIYYQSNGLKVQGFISTDGHSTSDLQFLFVNCRLVLKTRIHELIRLVLSKYMNSKGHDSIKSGSADAASPRKLSNPIFTFNIMCPFNEYDICFEPRKTLIEFEDWEKVLGVMKDVLRTFLHDEGYKYEDDDKYLKVSSSTSQTVYPDQASSIDTSNSKNALFSLVIKRPKPKRRPKRKSKAETETPEKELSPPETKRTPTQSVPPDYSQYGSHFAMPYATYPPSTSNKPCNDNRFFKQDMSVPFTTQYNQDNIHTSNVPYPSRAGQCAPVGYRDYYGQYRTENSVPLPVALHFNTKPSSLSVLKNRKYKETKLNDLKDIFEYQKQPKQTRGPARSRPYDEQRGGRSYQRKPRNILKDDFIKPATCFPNTSSNSDIIDFSDLDTQFDPDMSGSFSEDKCYTSSSQKPVDDKWSILSQSQEIINATEPFVVTQPFSVQQQRLDCDASVKGTSGRKSSPTTSDQDFFQFLDSGPAGSSSGGYSKCPNRTASQNPPVNLTNTTPFRDNSTFYTGQASSTAVVSDSSGAYISNSNTALVPTSTTVQGHVHTNTGPNQNCSISHSISSAYPSSEGRLKSNKDTHSEQQDWIQWQDLDSGNILYINIATGNSSYVPPPLSVQNRTPHVQQQRRDGHFFLSHNSTPFLPRQDRKVNNVEESTLANCKTMLDTWQNPVFKRSDFKEISNSSIFVRKPVIRSYSIVQNYKFYKSMFENLKVLGQIDRKFIACMVSTSFPEQNGLNFLVVFDQHAVHERIRVEQFTKEMYNSAGEVRTSPLQSPLRLEVISEHARLARAYSNQLEKTTGLGIEMERNPCSVALNLKCVPTCLLEREASELKNSRPSVLASLAQSLLEEQLQMLKETGNFRGGVPKTLHNVLSSRACKGAIKFGDHLGQEDCNQLIKHLCSCQLPFQCAHGRPSVVPVLDMNHITKPLHWKVQRPRLFRLKTLKCKCVM